MGSHFSCSVRAVLKSPDRTASHNETQSVGVAVRIAVTCRVSAVESVCRSPVLPHTDSPWTFAVSIKYCVSARNACSSIELSGRKGVTIGGTMVNAFKSEAGVATNASFQLDSDTLRPTYELTMGVPGRSYAMAVAERLGLPKAIKNWSLRSVQVKLIKIGARLVCHPRRLVFQLVEVAAPRGLSGGAVTHWPVMSGAWLGQRW